MLYFFNDYSSGNYLQPQCLPKYFLFFFYMDELMKDPSKLIQHVNNS